MEGEEESTGLVHELHVISNTAIYNPATRNAAPQCRNLPNMN